uniref:NTF2 domain-containing protein n=1 Tax=Anopheles farauti TaxID=69004 RepID=A0A182Q390_9DIPT
MVMDAQPSPQNVGREFVRQYYTLLNKAPDHLHRFYNNSSSFVHGGLDAKSQDATLVIGQKQIHSKIQQLNFRDCHAKISQVDSQATLGNGVVVQVTGELSNDGQPMRRFTQTFVLAAQSPKKYYVHNDIFRYQDVYTDDELDEGCDSRANGADEDGLHQLGADPTGTEVIGEQLVGNAGATPTNPGVSGVHGVHGPTAQQTAVPAAVLGGQNAAPQALYYPAAAAAGLLPGGVTGAYVGAPTSAAQTQASGVTPQQQQQAPQPQQPQQLNGLHESLLKNVGAAGDGATAAVVAAVLLSSSNDPQGLVKSKLDGQTPLSVASHLLPGQHHQQQQQQHQSQLNQSQPPTNNQLGLGQSHQPQQQQLPVQQASQHQQQQPNRHQLSSLNDADSGSSSQFGDNHQLFLGNIPHHATEEELKTLFSKFGTVVDLRIMSKPVQKMPGVRTPPHYGFITYDDPSSVQNCLSNMPLYFPENSPDGHKLNVEEKKTRVRGPGEGSGRMNSGGGGGGGMGGNANSNGPRVSGGGAGSGQSRPPGGQGSGGVSSNRGGGGSGQRNLGGGGGGNVGGSGGGNRGSGGGSYGQRADRGGNNVGNGQRSVGNGNAISNRGFGSGY